MDGFVLPEKTAVLAFAGSEYEGAEVKVRLSVKLGLFESIFTKIEGATSAGEVVGAAKDWADAALISWNLKDPKANKAIPSTPEGLMEVDSVFLHAMMIAWAEAVANPPAPLLPPSVNTDSLAAASVPTAAP